MRKQNNLVCSMGNLPACLCAFVIPKEIFTYPSVARQKYSLLHTFQWKDVLLDPSILLPNGSYTDEIAWQILCM